MPRSREEIVRDLLKKANYYWYDENEDGVNPLNPDDYDPVVDKLFKANAVELEKLHAEIDESKREIILGLAKTLVPDQSLFPEPGYTVAQLNPKAFRVSTSPEDRYHITGQSDTGEKFEFYFTPLFEHNYPKCEVAAIITDHTAFQVVNNVPEILLQIAGGTSTSSIWVGLDIPKFDEGDHISFFLGDRVVDKFDRDHHVIHTAKWLLNGESYNELEIKTGIDGFKTLRSQDEKPLLDALDVANSYEKRIYSRFRNSFIHLALPRGLSDAMQLTPPDVSTAELASALKVTKPLCWIKLECSLPVPDSFLTNHFLYPNCIPLVNRRLQEDHVVKNNYDRLVLPMQTTDMFLDVCRVQDTKNLEDGTEYQKVDFLHPDSSIPGTYLLRSGSRVRRMNKDDASQQINRLLEVINDEYSTFKEEGVNRLKQDFDIIDKAINRIKSQLPDYFRDRDSRSSFFCIAHIRRGVSRIRYTYWETQGDLIRHLGFRTSLQVASNDVKISDSRSIIPIQQGTSELTGDEYINQLKMSLLSRGKIMTRGDIELYCQTRYSHLLEMKEVGRRLMMLNHGQLGRGILVTVRPVGNLTSSEIEIIRVQFQNDLNSRSAFFTDIKVEVEDGQ